MEATSNKPAYNLREYQRADSIQLMTPPYPAMDTKLWRQALDTMIRNHPNKPIAPFQIMVVYRKLKK